MVKIIFLNGKILANYLFPAITGYYIIGVVRVLMPFSDADIDSLRFKSGMAVLCMTIIFWIIKLGQSLMEIPFKIRERKYKDKIQKLEYEKKLREYKEDGISDDDIKEFLKHK